MIKFSVALAFAVQVACAQYGGYGQPYAPPSAPSYGGAPSFGKLGKSNDIAI